MLLGGKGGCQQCSCVPCNACTATCTNPHTGTAFATVYHYYVLGAEAGNVTDGYLTAGGDVDTSDPYDGMDGTGPWYQDITGSFSFSPEQTRYPCVIRLSFWRNSFPLGATTIPPPSSSLTGNTIKVNCTFGAVKVGDRVINAGELYDTGIQVPSVTGAGDQSAADPRSWLGTISIAPVCDSASFTVTARIDWNTKKRQHILYGTVRECYEYPPNPCSGACGGSGRPATLYVTLTNISFTNAKYNYAGDGTSPGPSDTVYTPAILSDWQSLLTSAVATDRVPNFCTQWQECVDASGGLCTPCVTVVYKDSGAYGYGGLTDAGGPSSTNLSVYLMSRVNYNSPGVLGGCNEWVNVYFTLGNYDPCSPFDKSGSATGRGIITSNTSGYGGISFDASCDWRVTT